VSGGRLSSLLAALLASGLVIAGCGSSSLSKDTYLSRGDAICKQAGTAEAGLKAPPKGNLPATATYLRSSATLIDSELAKLRKLAKPKGDGGRLGDLLSREGDAIATLRKAAAAAAASQQTSADALFTQAEGELSDVGAGLRDYGFTVCGT
jgi:cytochrome c556